MKSNDILAGIGNAKVGEVLDTLLQTESFKLERIVSTGQSTPAGEWLQEKTNEWVLLLTGHAEILFEGDDEPLCLKGGDYVHIPSHRKHRVVLTDPTKECVWLALHYQHKIFMRDNDGQMATTILAADTN